ncbi:MAG TPA: histidine kinase dimerization/phospho-acceptor domain-containing protein, partial [Myxococcota bacterium]|nr:histidine kinase dimerization/phospho-acceptor domain-containing protein [Myxococcota bacterium]
MAELAASLNQLSAALARYQERTRSQLTHLEAANAELRTAQDALVQTEKLASVGRLAAGLAHELGNPLTAVRGYLALLKMEAAGNTETAEVLGIPPAELAAWRPRRPRAYRAGTRLVATGPLYARLDLPIPEAVERFLDRSEPTALVVLSSVTPELLRRAVRRVRAAGPRVIVGATIHDYGPNDDPGVVVAGLLPNHRVMPRVDVAVTMGGQGTVQTAMACGTPLVGIP